MGQFAEKTPESFTWTCCICGEAVAEELVNVVAYVHEDGAAQQFAAHAACFGERLAPEAQFDYELLTDG